MQSHFILITACRAAVRADIGELADYPVQIAGIAFLIDDFNRGAAAQQLRGIDVVRGRNALHMKFKDFGQCFAPLHFHEFQLIRIERGM